MSQFQPLREVLKGTEWKRGDVLVVFGEVFQRGYANGLIDEAKHLGMSVIYSTVGRRDDSGNLRALNSEEIKEKDQPTINVPLEAGFDLQKSRAGKSPVDQLQGIKLSEWENLKLDWNQIHESLELGVSDFKKRVAEFVSQLKTHIPNGANVIIAHTMAGGVPRAKIVMPAMNRVFKGHGDRFFSSKAFWEGEMGRLCEQSFMEVTANTFQHLIDATAELRKTLQKSGGRLSYVAYGYHGTEVLMGDEYQWQSYAPYLQGFAKIELENIAERAMKNGISATVFNAPEILTNSSSIFLGVEIPLYSLLGAFNKEVPNHPFTKRLVSTCNELLKPEHSLEEIKDLTNNYFRSDIIKRWTNFKAWPQHNGPEQMEIMRNTSDKIIDMHKDERHLLTGTLSEIVFKGCGHLMLHEAWAPRKSVFWIGHDVIAKTAASEDRK